MATYLNYYRMLWAYLIERTALFQVCSEYKPKNLRVSKYKSIPYSVKLCRWKNLTNLMSACWIVQIFRTKILHRLRKFRHCIFYDYNLLTWVCQGSSRYVGTWNPEVPSSDYPYEGCSWRQGFTWRKEVTQSIWAIP